LAGGHRYGCPCQVPPVGGYLPVIVTRVGSCSYPPLHSASDQSAGFWPVCPFPSAVLRHGLSRTAPAGTRNRTPHSAREDRGQQPAGRGDGQEQRPARRQCGQGAPKPPGPAVARRLPRIPAGRGRRPPAAAGSGPARPLSRSEPRACRARRRRPARAALLAGMASRRSRSVGGKQRRLEAVYTRHPSDPSSRNTLGWLSACLRRWRR
jgi:hypothetical protein